MAHISKIYRLIQNTLKITFPEKKATQCKNVICIIKNLEANFYAENNYDNCLRIYYIQPIKKLNEALICLHF